MNVVHDFLDLEAVADHENLDSDEDEDQQDRDFIDDGPLVASVSGTQQHNTLRNTMRNDKATIPLSTTSKTEQRPLLPLSNPLSQFEQPRHSFVDKVTLAGSRKLHTSEVAPVNIPAVDQWLGKNALLSNGYADADSDPQGDFSPLDVSLFDLAILAEVVHEEYPLYSIFKNQCYWFSHLILKAIIVISGLNKDANPGPDPTAMLISSLPATTPDSGDRMLTQNDFKFPSRQGTWRGMKISEITPIVLASVIGKYLERRVIELVKIRTEHSRLRAQLIEEV